MVKRILILALLVATIGVVFWFMSTTITPPTKTIGVLQYQLTNLATLEGFKEGMHGLGHVEGESIRYVFDGPTMDKGQLEAAMQALLAQKPDLVFACTTPAALVAKKLTEGTGIPVVFAPVNDPVTTGVVANIKTPEGNITGIRLARSEGKRLQSLLEVVPSVKRIFVPYNPVDKSALASLAQIKSALPMLGVEMVTKEFRQGIDVKADASYVPQDIDAILLPREGLVMNHNKDFVVVAMERKLPLSVPRYSLVEQGALTAHGFRGFEIGMQAARMAHVILSGTPVSGVPVETADEYLFINMDTAGKINVDIPETVLRRAHLLIR